jgi:hypothetical protein
LLRLYLKFGHDWSKCLAAEPGLLAISTNSGEAKWTLYDWPEGPISPLAVHAVTSSRNFLIVQLDAFDIVYRGI